MRVVFVAVAVAVAVALAGCSKMNKTAGRTAERAENAAKALSIDYLEFQNAHQGRPPASAPELAAFVQGRDKDAALEPGELDTLSVQWGAKLDPRSADATKRVLAAGQKIGSEIVLLMQDGSVRWVPEPEFASLPKAEPVKGP